MKQRILFRCDGAQIAEIGTGHVRRSLVLANLLRERDVFIEFLMKDYKLGVRMVQDAGYTVHIIDSSHPNETKTLEYVLDRFRPDICVFDRLDTTTDLIEICRRYHTVIVTLDDLGAGFDKADIVINAIKVRRPTFYLGPQYLVLPTSRSIENNSDADETLQETDSISVFLSFGGYDYSDLSARVLDAIKELPNINHITVVIGEGSSLEEGTQDKHNGQPSINIMRNIDNFSHVIASSTLAIISGGLTLFEAMKNGVPSMVIAQYPHQEETALHYEKLGATVSIGLALPGFEKRLIKELTILLNDTQYLSRLRQTGKRLLDENGAKRVADLISVCKPLSWDTSFFGLKIARLVPERLTESIVKYANMQCEYWEIDCLYYLSDCHHASSTQLAEKYGFHFVDIRLTFEYNLQKQELLEDQSVSYIIRSSALKDIPQLRNIARNSYIHSRYYFDQSFPQDRLEAFYTEWIEKSCYGYADIVLVAIEKDTVLGYITCHIVSDFVGSIQLVGVSEKARGKGVGKAIVNAALDWFLQHGIQEVEVVTQGRNYTAQRLYQRCGFVTKSTQLWYHKWFRR